MPKISEGVKAAKGILDLLFSGNADKITDEMLSKADQRYLFENYDLPMDEASRMARAKEMGASEQIYYHGTPYGDIPQINPSRSGAAGPGSYVAQEPSEANLYARKLNPSENPELAAGENVIPVRVMGEQANIRDFYLNKQKEMVEAIRRGERPSFLREDVAAQKPIIEEGYTGILNPLTGNAVMFEGKNIRSTSARFDPRLSHLHNLMASRPEAAAAIGGLLAEKPGSTYGTFLPLERTAEGDIEFAVPGILRDAALGIRRAWEGAKNQDDEAAIRGLLDVML